jgi:voltage-gated potassium channel
MSASRRVLLGLLVLLAITIVGVAGYRIIEGWSLFDALYMTIITITTVGYAEVHPLSTDGRVFTMVLVVGGVGGALYALVGIMQFVVEGQFGTTLARRRMDNRISQLRRHFILCGYGRVGEEIARGFAEEHVPFVIIDNSTASLGRLAASGYLYIEGDATKDEVLKRVGIEHARGLVAAVGTDADNTYIVLSARGLRPDLFIEARASDTQAEAKLKRAGANRVVSRHHIGGRRMAMLALRPAVVDFIDTVTKGAGREMLMESVDISQDSRLVNTRMRDLRRDTGITVLADWKKDGTFLPNPNDEEQVSEGDRLVVVGSAKSLEQLERAAGLRDGR